MGVARIPFEPQDERRIASAASWGLITALTSLAAVAITILVSTSSLAAVADSPLRLAVGGTELLVTLGFSAVMVLLDVFLIQASLAFRKVALTDVADQHYLLTGFAKLRNYFMLLGILLILAFLGAAAMFFLG